MKILFYTKFIFIVNMKNGAKLLLPYKILEPNENGEENDIDRRNVK